MTTLTKVFRKLPSHRHAWRWRVAHRGLLTPKPSSKRYSPRGTSILWSCFTCKPAHPRPTHPIKLVLKVCHRQLLQQCRRHRLSTPLRAVPQRLQTPEVFHNSDQHISNNYVRCAGRHDTHLCVDVGLVVPGRAMACDPVRRCKYRLLPCHSHVRTMHEVANAPCSTIDGEHHLLRLPGSLGHPDRLALDMLHPRRVRRWAVRPVHGMGARDLHVGQRGTRHRRRVDERDGVCTAGLAVTDRVAAD